MIHLGNEPKVAWPKEYTSVLQTILHFHHWRPLEAACGHIIHLPCFYHVDCEVCSNPTHIKFIFRISLTLISF